MVHWLGYVALCLIAIDGVLLALWMGRPQEQRPLYANFLGLETGLFLLAAIIAFK